MTGVTSFEFETVYLNGLGQVSDSARHTGICFTEKLALGVNLELIWIPGGSFLMGATPDEIEHSPDEIPQHPVAVNGFWMGKFLVTQAQWRAIADLPLIHDELEPISACHRGADYPVEQISWFEAIEFCERLVAKTGRSYRFPSEAEWEYACRAGTSTPFHFGDVLNRSAANYNSQARGSKIQKYGKQTTPVGSFGIANAFGLYDMHGNVYEWCVDHWHVNYYGAPTDGTAWIWDGDSTRRVIRGGSWHDVVANCRSAFRAPDDAEDGHDDLGFRVVCQDLGIPEQPDIGASFRRYVD
ncbi:formylglycine-generating enzyme family protein [Leptolyngbya sp. PCC 6406]|uniref:formylglycine-generating enzyme family protein n=1 Tax=Leptolyngbya sp. PCC 6406 TaxID=1173264 RepID=UPI0002ABFE44|nr:formylglycine-generating enzyme family protein [Leptolyngbya sp. PCC 6406]